MIRDDRASVDAPACLFWRELTDAYPTAKVILSTRDPEAWYESARETIYHSSGPGADPSRLGDAPPDLGAGIAAITELNRATFWHGVMGGCFLDRDHAIAVYEKHDAAIRAALLPDHLLVWEAPQGWAPLCAFLGVPVPADPFPRVNDRNEFRGRLAAHPDFAAWRDRERA